MAGSIGVAVDAPVAPADPKGRLMSPNSKPGCGRPGIPCAILALKPSSATGQSSIIKVRSAGALRDQDCCTANVSTQAQQEAQRIQGNTGKCKITQ